MRDRWRRRLRTEVTRLRTEGRGALLWSLRITVAAVASYVVGTLFFPGTQPLLAPLTAMLVVQVTPVSLLASGLDRVVAVVTGVALAVAFATVLPLEWWSLGLLIFICIVLGHLLRLRANLIEVAISGMLVLGVGSLGAESAAWQRIAETLVGAGVGIAVNLLFPPRVPTGDAARAIEGLSDSVSALLTGAAEELDDLADRPREVGSAAGRWLDEARRITHHEVPRVGASLIRAEQGRRLNVRAVGRADVGPGLRHGIEALEHTAVAVRSMFRSIADATAAPTAAWLQDGEDGRREDEDRGAHDERGEDVLHGLAQTLRELAAGVDAFGELVRIDASPARQLSSADLGALRASLAGMHEARGRTEQLLRAEIDPELRELATAVLSTVKRLLRELDLEQRVRRQVRLRRPAHPRPPYLRPPATRRRPVGSQDVTPEEETRRLPRITDEPPDE